jgi:choline-glycine betaine transporter
MHLKQFGTYYTAAIDVVVLAWASLADIDTGTRLIAALVGLVVGVLTCVRLIQKLKVGKDEAAITKLNRKQKEEEVRRYFQIKYNNESNRNSEEISGTQGGSK